MTIGSVGVGSMGGDHGRGQFQGFSYMPTSQLEVRNLCFDWLVDVSSLKEFGL